MKSLVKEWLQFKQLNEGRSPETIKKYAYYLVLYHTYCEEHLVNPFEIKPGNLEQFTRLY